MTPSPTRPPPAPIDEYRARREARQGTDARLGRADAVIAYSRLAVFVAIVVVAILGWKARAFSGLWLLAPVVAFIALVVIHDRVIRARRRAEWAVRFYADGIARLEDRAPAGDGRSARFADEHHVYASDLDLFGVGSLYERLSTARTSMGEETFADWLKRPAAPAVVRARQQAVAELAPRLDLKEDLAVKGLDLRLDVNPRSLTAWAAAPAVPEASVPFGLAGARVVTAALGVAITAVVVAWLAGRVGLLPVISAALLGVGWTMKLRAVVKPILLDADRRAGELKLLALLLARLERESFASPLLVELRRALETTGQGDARRRRPRCAAAVTSRGAAGAAGRPARRAPQPDHGHPDRAAAVDGAVRAGDRGLAAALRTCRRPLAGRGGRDRGADLARDLRVRAPRAPLPDGGGRAAASRASTPRRWRIRCCPPRRASPTTSPSAAAAPAC